MGQSSHLAVTGALGDLVQVVQQSLLLLLKQLLPVGIEVCTDGLVVERPHVNPAHLRHRSRVGREEASLEAVQGSASLNSRIQATHKA